MPHAHPRKPNPRPRKPNHPRRSPDASAAEPTEPTERTYRIGCVSFLNSKPLIRGVEDHPQASVRLDVPAQLLATLERGETDIALLPVIDYFRATLPLRIHPVGGIGCEGPTLTVRLFSRVPIDQIQQIHADTDSHTSVALLQVLLHAKLGRVPQLIDYHAREGVVDGKLANRPEAMLLIGDKVVTASPLAAEYPHQMDLGEAWNQLTGLPFVFAVWMSRDDADLGDLPAILNKQRQENAGRINAIAEHYAPLHGWPVALTREYFTDILRYPVGKRELEAIERFGEMAGELGITPGRFAGGLRVDQR